MNSINRILGNFIVIIDGLTRRKIRSFLTLLVIAIGIASVVGLTAIGGSIMGFIGDVYEKTGGKMILILPGSGFSSYAGGMSTATLNENDLNAIKEANGIDFAATMNFKMAKAEYNNHEISAYLIGVEPDNVENMFLKGFGIDLESGRYFKNGENNKVLLGYRYCGDKDTPFKKLISLGEKMKIEDKSFQVIGCFSQIGSSEDDQQIYISDSAFEEIYGKQKSYYGIMVVAENGVNVTNLAEQISEKLRKEHALKKGEEDFTVQTYGQLMESFDSVFSVVTIAVTGIASISLIIGSVGIANTMFTAVLERTREIGSMKSVGATDGDILFIFITEAAFFGLVGGLFGVIFGYGISFAFSFFAKNVLKMFFFTKISWVLVLQMLAFSTLLGAFSGFFPARRASKMNVADAIRYE